MKNYRLYDEDEDISEEEILLVDGYDEELLE